MPAAATPTKNPVMSDTPPDRLSTDPDTKYYGRALCDLGCGSRVSDVEKTKVEEYGVSEGWVRLAVGKTVDRHGKPMTIKYKGTVEPYLQNPEHGPEAQ